MIARNGERRDDRFAALDAAIVAQDAAERGDTRHANSGRRTVVPPEERRRRRAERHKQAARLRREKVRLEKHAAEMRDRNGATVANLKHPAVRPADQRRAEYLAEVGRLERA